jgi:broad specificity polyphosphatase/5'/3'-nucleotidase SurE
MSNQFRVGDKVIVVNNDGTQNTYFTSPAIIVNMRKRQGTVTIVCPTKPDTAISAYRTHIEHGVSMKNIKHVQINKQPIII